MNFVLSVVPNFLGNVMSESTKYLASRIFNAGEDPSILEAKLVKMVSASREIVRRIEGASFAGVPLVWLDALVWCIYEIEDIMDSIKLAGSNPDSTGLTANLLKTSFNRATVVQTQLITLEMDMKYSCKEPEAESAQRLPHAPTIDGILEKEKKDIIDKLVKGPGFGVAIVGICGTGKTVLAKAIARDLSKDFRYAFMPLGSSMFDPKGALDSLKKEDATEDPTGSSKKVLIILDGLESVDSAQWREFLDGLDSGSRVLITTQNPQVADTTRTTKCCLGSASHSDCLLLIRSIVKDSRNASDVSDLHITKDDEDALVDKCKGLPLLALHIGMLLSAATGEERDRAVARITANSLWKQRGLDRVLASLRPISLLATNPHLQRCVAYCSLFPLNHKFLKDTLLQLWMAEGFRPAHTTTDDVDFSKCPFQNLLSCTCGCGG